jgi:hypothetical protein
MRAMMTTEWAALECESVGHMKDARQYRQAFTSYLERFEKTLPKTQTPAPAPVVETPEPPTLKQHLTTLAKRKVQR